MVKRVARTVVMRAMWAIKILLQEYLHGADFSFMARERMEATAAHKQLAIRMRAVLTIMMRV